ncbi:hypothetical protein [Rubritalea tangerina]|uniref:hypothetical protein n=1 Tax=Rubritalea tangerina TaxID=430798 RepID=UPI003614CD9A
MTELQRLLLKMLFEQQDMSRALNSPPALRKSLALLANTHRTVTQIARDSGMGYETFVRGLSRNMVLARISIGKSSFILRRCICSLGRVKPCRRSLIN